MDSFPTIEFGGKRFDPNRDFEMTDERTAELSPLYRHYETAYKKYAAEALRAEVYKTSQRPVEQLGAYLGTIWNVVVASYPISIQNESIQELNNIMLTVREKNPSCNPTGELAGFKGEFAAACLIEENRDLKVYHATLAEDLYHKTDWRARDIQGKKYGIQVKTLSLGAAASRKNTNIFMPVFSRIATPQELQQFKNELYDLPVEANTFEAEKIAELADEADKIQKKILELGRIPVICVLGSPYADNADISKDTARPFDFTRVQAAKDWEKIIAAK